MSDSKEDNCVYYFGEFCLDPENKSLTKRGETQKIQPMQAEILVILVKNSNQLVTKAKLKQHVWPGLRNDSLHWQISMLRKILGDQKTVRGGRIHYEFIESVAKVGYQFVAAVKKRRKRTGSLKPAAAGLAIKESTYGRNRPTLAVLPFKVQGNSRDKYLPAGMVYSLTAKLSTLKELMVRQPGSVFRCSAETNNPLLIARKLRVKWLLEGEIRRSRGGIVVMVRLTNVALKRSVWTQEFREANDHPFAIQNSISAAVAIQLTTLARPGTKMLLVHQTENLAAYQLYVNGRNYWNHRTKAGLFKAINYFKLSINEDPKYARAYAGLADCYNLLSYYSGLPPQQVFPKAMVFAREALRMDANLAEAHTSYAYAISRYFWKWKDAEQGYKRAIELNPSYPSAHQWYAEHLTAMGRFEEAEREVRQAQTLDPLSPVISAAIGTVCYFARNYDKAIEHYRTAILERPDFARTRFRLARAYVQRGMFKEAIKECNKALKLSGKTKEIVQLGQAYAFAGQVASAFTVIRQLERISKTSYVSEYNIAIIYVGLKNYDEAFRWLEKAYRSRDPWLEHLNVDPRLDEVRSDRRFKTLLKRVRLNN